MLGDFLSGVLICGIFAIGYSNGDPYYGTRIGKFSTHFHDVKGDVYAVDEKTIFIKNFNYDGKGTDTFFWAGTSIRPDPSGFIVPGEGGSTNNLNAYNGKDILLRLPDEKTVKDIRWLAVWSKRFRANFGSLIFPKTLHPPQPVIIGPLQNTQHEVSSGDILILDTQTFLVPNFSYDGTGSEVYWWLSRGMKPNTGGIQLMDEDHSDFPLKKYVNETVVVSVPEGYSIFDYETLSVWSKTDIEDYGMVKIPPGIRVPPSSRSLGIVQKNKLNCEILNDNLGFEARWAIDSDQLVMQLTGKLGLNEYMALGLSKDDTETKFTSADAAVVWISNEGQGHAIDYYFQNPDKCENGQGMCPDSVHEGAKNSIFFLNAAERNNSIMVTFRRPLKAVDELYDQNIYTDGPQAVLWAVGAISEDGEPEPPKLRTRGNLLLDFGREPIWNCPSPEETKLISETDSVPVEVESIHCPIDHIFKAQMGPSMHANGPQRIWYINGLASPVLTVQRGETYTFLVEGGNNPPSHHPLYITSSEEGGLYQKILEANEDGEVVFAGVTTDPITGALLPTAEGRLCEWSASSDSPEYTIITTNMKTQQALSLNCDSGDAGILSWTPDINTSSTVYYQSFTEKNLGGQIRITDFCEETDPEYYLQESQTRRDSAKEKQSTKITNKENDLEREDEGNEGAPSDFIIEAPILSSNLDYNHDDTHVLPESEQQAFSDSNTETKEFSTKHVQDEKTLFDVDHLLAYGMNIGIKQKNSEKMSSATNQVIKPDIKKFLETPDGQSNIKLASEIISTTQSTLQPDASESVLSVYPYDESERSDTNILELRTHKPSSNDLQRNRPANNLQKNHFHNNFNSKSQFPVDAPQPAKSPVELNVQFEGGFVPLVLNPSKETESVIRRDFIKPPSHFRRPHRPFLFNESIPFHGTFKPGVPDFSGFNISHYTQDTNLNEPNHLTDHIALLSAPKPQLIQKPASQLGGLPPELFRRPNNGITRPQLMGYGVRHQMLHLPTHPQLLYQLPTKQQPNFLITAPENEDLDSGSSQRVQISLQSANEKKLLKDIMSTIPVRQPNDRNRHPGFIGTKMIAPSPPIQRRPDVVDDDDENYSSQQRPPLRPKFPPPRIPTREQSDMNKKLHAIHLRPSGIRRPQPFKRIPSGINNNAKDRRPQIPQRIQHTRPDTGIKTHGVFIQHPPVARPHQHQEILQPDNPFVYRLPDRPPLPQLKQPSKIPSNLDTRHHPIPYETTGISPDVLPENVLINGNVAHEMIPRPFQSNENHEIPPSHDHKSLEHAYIKLPPKPVVKQANSEPRPINPIHNLNNEHYVQQSSVRPHFKDGNWSEDEIIEGENDRAHPQEQQFLPENHNENAENIELKKSQGSSHPENSQDNGQIISVKKLETQEIHLPPVYVQNIPQNMEYSDIAHILNAFGPNSEINIAGINFPKQEPPKTTVNSETQTHLLASHLPTNLRDTNIHNKLRNGSHIPDKSKIQDKVPFGARLKTKHHQSGTSNIQVKPIFQQQQRPVFPSRREPQFSSTPPKEVHYIPTATTNKPEKQPQKTNSGLYFNPAMNRSKITVHSRLEQHEKKAFLPKPADSDKLTLATYPGRKNILPSDINSSASPPKLLAKAPENIQLPHISQMPPSNDNGTDYSILSHVLSLIGGQPQHTHMAIPQTS